MPGLFVVKPLAYAAFSANQIRLGAAPAQLAPGGAIRKPGTFPPAVTIGPKGGPTPCPPALFVAASDRPADLQYQKAQHEYYKRLLDSMIDSVTAAHQQWKTLAFFSDAQIMGVTAVGGKLNGPRLDGLPGGQAHAAGFDGPALQLYAAMMKGVAESFKLWQDGIMIPGLPWYPSFAAFPGPQVPPTPNVPSVLASCPSRSVQELSVPQSLQARMTRSFSSKFAYSDQLFGALAGALSGAFLNWISSQMITQVLGTGPVPTFAPPYVPVGPVVNGSILPTPGHLNS